MKTHLLLVVAVLAAGGLVAAACGGGASSADKTETAEIILDETAVPTLPPPTEEAQGDAGGETDTGGDNGGEDSGGAPSTLDLVGKNTIFDTTKLEAAAGEITIEFDNQDPGVSHNIAIYESEDAANAGESPIAATPLEVGLKKQTLEVTLEAGEYFYRCDAHPSTMAGTLTVK